jgi:hypothetical protein
MGKKELDQGPKKMSRREFIKGTVAYALAFGGFYIGAELSPFLGLFSEKASGSVTPEDLKELISVNDGIEIDIPNDQKRKVYVDKDAFCYFLFNIFKSVSPHDGPQRLQAILKRRPLEIALNSDKYKQFLVKGVVWDREATYTPCMTGGPKIMFCGDFLRDYRKNQVNTDIDIAGQLGSDAAVVHEMVHVWRDMYSPFSVLTSSLDYVVHNTPEDEKYYEIEENRISGAFIENLYQSYVASPESKNWHFGRVFHFV